jgi:hypothetical protein
MATCSNCNSGTTAEGYVSGSSSYPNAQYGYYYSYPSTCPGGCLYLTNQGYRCSNSVAGTGTGCGCNGGCGCGNSGGCGCSGS